MIQSVLEHRNLWVATAIGLSLLSIFIGVLANREDGENRRLIRFFAVLFAIVAALSLIGGMSGAALAQDAATLVITLISAFVLMIIGLIQWAIETSRSVKIKQGLLTVSLGILFGVSSLLFPVIPSQLTAPPPATPTPTMPPFTRTPQPTRTPRVTFTPTPIPSETLTPTPLPTLTAVPTRGIPTLDLSGISVTTGTPGNGFTPNPTAPLPTRLNPNFTVTPPPVTDCVITPFRNVNLREQPDSSSKLLTTIPFGTQLTGLAQVRDGRDTQGNVVRGWWKVRYGELEGWITREFADATVSCARLR